LEKFKHELGRGVLARRANAASLPTNQREPLIFVATNNEDTLAVYANSPPPPFHFVMHTHPAECGCVCANEHEIFPWPTTNPAAAENRRAHDDMGRMNPFANASSSSFCPATLGRKV
jgi:hypothetical protein